MDMRGKRFPNAGLQSERHRIGEQAHGKHPFTRSIPSSVWCWILAVPVLSALSACDDANNPDTAASASGSMVSAPVTLNIYPVAATTQNPARLFINLSAVGGASVSLPLALDTGSAGVTLNAFKVFPSDLVNETGFIFPPNQTSLQYQGITVTNQQGTRTYGGSTGKTEIGNIGYATVTFGDPGGTLTTDTIPVFLYYAVTDNSSNEQAAPQTQQGWFGINDSANLITIAGTTKPAAGYPACSSTSFGSCYVVSPLKYLTYTSSLDAGFFISPTALQSCDILAEGSCSPVAALTVGLTSTAISGYHESQLTCPAPASGYSGPQQINGFNACDDVIELTTLSAGAPTPGSFQTGVIFDTGTPYFAINVPTGDAFPASIGAGTMMTISVANGFDYFFTATSTGVDSVTVTSDSSSASVIGLGYFSSTAFFLTDYATSLQGFK